MNIEDAALRYLSARNRTVFEMRKHLQEKGFDKEAVDELIEAFLRCGYLSDADYCREYFRYAFGKGKGRWKVFYELKEKGVDPSLTEIAFEDFIAEEDMVFDERERAMEEAKKVLRMAEIQPGEPVPEKILGRIGRKLQAKGYGGDVIYSVLGHLRKQEVYE